MRHGKVSPARTSAPYDDGDQYLLDSGIHMVDLAAFLCGPIRSVYGVKGQGATFAVTLTFNSGVTGSLSLTDRMSYQRDWEQVTVITTDGLCVQADNSVEMLAFHRDKPVAAHKPEFVSGGAHSSREMGFVGELQAFVDAIAQKVTPESSIAEATHTMAVLDAITRSVRSGIPTHI